MRGRFQDQTQLFSYVSPERRVPANHPLRLIRQLVRDVLKELSRSLGELYASEGRPSVPPEQLLSALSMPFEFSPEVPAENSPLRFGIAPIKKDLPRCSEPSRTVASGARRFAVPSASLTAPARRGLWNLSGRRAS
jgi:hypothetical protein